MRQIRFLYNFVKHALNARNTKGHGIHSPFLFQLAQFVIYDKSQYYIFSEIENLREKLKQDDRKIWIEDFGTGRSREQKVSEIASRSLKQARYGQLLYKIINFCKAQNILELGTSLGITTAYLAANSSNINCLTLEGSTEVAKLAIENLNKIQIINAEVVTGNIDDTLPVVLKRFEKLDFVFIDANHRLPEVYQYFEKCVEKIHHQSIVVVDDIYWSKEMEQAWNMIKKHPKVTSTFDLFQCGIVFFNHGLNKYHYKMCY